MTKKKSKRFARKKVSRGHKKSDSFHDSMKAVRRSWGDTKVK